MIGNLHVKRDDNGNLSPSKKKSVNKIDGPVALVTGMACALRMSAPLSIYETRGIEAL